ncbi:hypothetical protein [Hydrogenothermus marinus]|uniref:Uncharacterized protein n=1 Tax=Hydrogenothermus marinus TaxID=133270 RepID=A0A3M0BRF3_9AQUI|nr:hypothetical protein [Hydrogenothermus marinus]RMB00074.1 hypothetical protein CLV39_0044 [Hydrogenothermus marinus]
MIEILVIVLGILTIIVFGIMTIQTIKDYYELEKRDKEKEKLK